MYNSYIIEFSFAYILWICIQQECYYIVFLFLWLILVECNPSLMSDLQSTLSSSMSWKNFVLNCIITFSNICQSSSHKSSGTHVFFLRLSTSTKIPLVHINLHVLNLCTYVYLYVPISLFRLYFFFSFSPLEDVYFTSLVKFISIKLYIIFFYLFNIYRICNDVISLIPDINYLCSLSPSLSLSFIWLEVTQFYFFA